MWKVVAGVLIGMLVIPGRASAETSIVHGSDGTTGTLYELGGIGVYQDSHGTTRTIPNLGTTPPNQVSPPGGPTQPGTAYRFGPSASKPIPVIPAPPSPSIRRPALPSLPPSPFEPHTGNSPGSGFRSLGER